jgi:short-subunit dehydrogenase
MPVPLEQAAVVITGASSGIGRAAALRIARRGGSLALCGRSFEPLLDVARQCEAAGATVHAEALDVSDEAAVEAFAAATVARFGRIDVWVNSAGVIAYGEFLEIPPDVFRQVIETNLMGQVHGARAALRHFRERGSGVLITMSSVWGRVSSPQVAPYVVSKSAVRTFAECLRGELVDEPEIHITTMAPQAVDTPIFEHGANYSRRGIRPIPPLLSTEEIAAGIEACAENPKREVNYGRAGRLLEVIYALAPALFRRLAHPAFVRGTFAARPVASSAGNVLKPTVPHAVDGGWRRRRPNSLKRAFGAATAAALGGIARREP